MPHEIGSFDDDGCTLSYEIYGTGPRPLVYLHGLLLDAHLNRRLATDLAWEGNRVILLDLPGHGQSGKPRHAAAHRMDAYAARVVRLLDELGIDQAVIGGMSLGADVTLQVALLAPERVKAMIVEMPVLEQATPVAALVFVPFLTLTHYAAPVLRAVAGLARRVPRRHLGPLDAFFGPLLLDPEETTAVLHGVLVGPVAPTADQRAAMTMPTIVIGHRSDRLHPFGDASRLARQLPDARLVEANSLLELRWAPARLTGEIATFLDEVWSGPAGQRAPRRAAS
jgi:pimeloyl-ACP methyl ester carboxylesterase